MAAPPIPSFPTLPVIQDMSTCVFSPPVKRINEGRDLPHFLQSKAYADIMSFILQLNRSMFPCRTSPSTVQSWEINSSHITLSDAVNNLRFMLDDLRTLIESTPPDPGPRRFGNISFRRWFELASSRAPDLLSRRLPNIPVTAHVELLPYLLGSFGSSQRLDYGSGHELSFLAFLGGCWKLGLFTSSSLSAQEASRAIVVGVIQPYLKLTRLLISTYTLEPAGSHGVWGLDDHSFIPYIFGSAQLGPPITDDQQTPTEGSLDSAPDQGDVASAEKAARWEDQNMYFSAISFIHKVKKGPFWEHSPMLYDISGVRRGWAKINKGMLKMYDAEVLGKFPVVQHFVFGSLFAWERDPRARDIDDGKQNAHLASQPQRTRAGEMDEGLSAGIAPAQPEGGMKAPWAKTAPTPPLGSLEGTKAPWATGGNLPNRGPPAFRENGSAKGIRDTMPLKDRGGDANRMPPPTRAPWAKSD